MAKNLHINTHYQLHMDSLESFLTLLENNNYKIMVTPQTKIQNRSVFMHLPTESCLLNDSLVIALSEKEIKKISHEFKAFNLIQAYKFLEKKTNMAAKDRNTIQFDMSFSGQNTTY